MAKRSRSVAEQLAELPRLDNPALRAKWSELFEQPAPRLRGDMLIRAIAYRIQELAYGGLTAVTKRRLRQIVEGLRAGREMGVPRSSSLQTGVRLMRDWNGETHVVEVLDTGFEWNGKVYSSLSAIARAITGARWSGPRFFGLADKGAGVPPDSGQLMKADP